MSISCEIVFVRNPTKVFYLGQPLRGYVHLAVKSEQDVHGIHVKLSGVTVANWKIGRATRRCTEDCLNHQTSIIGESRLVVRKYKFPFQFLLPAELPSSFEGEFGFIRYIVTVLIEIPFEPSIGVKEQVTVLRMIDMDDPDLQRKVSACDGFNPYFVLSCLPWFPVKIDAHVEPGTYAPGTIIDVGVNVTNKSFRSIQQFLVQLIKEVTYYSYDKSRKTKSILILWETEMRGCGQNQKYPICLGCQVRVPQTSPSDSASVIIKVRHFVRVTATMGRNYRPMLELPVTIVSISSQQKRHLQL